MKRKFKNPDDLYKCEGGEL